MPAPKSAKAGTGAEAGKGPSLKVPKISIPKIKGTGSASKGQSKLDVSSISGKSKAAGAQGGSTPPFLVPSAQEKRAQRQSAGEEASQRRVPSVKTVTIAIVAIALVLVVGAMTLTVLSRTSLFTIETVVAVPSEHVSEENILNLAKVQEGSTLLNVDAKSIEDNLMRNPWVGEVHIDRNFPSTLTISVKERQVKALVIMSSGEVVWCLGDGDVWIEPISVKAAEGQDFADAALQKAQEMGTLLISDVPASVSPEAGSKATDDSIVAVSSYIKEFSEDFSRSIVSYTAPSADSVSCTLDSGVTISLGAAEDIAAKESIIKELIDKHAGHITYINVRVPSSPSYRMIETESVQAGTGAVGESGVDPNAAQQSEANAAAGAATDRSATTILTESEQEDEQSEEESYDDEDYSY